MFRKTIAMLLLSLPLLAGAELVVVTSQDSRVGSLSQAEVRQYFLGENRSLDGHRVQLFDLPSGHPLRERFYQEVAGRSLDQMRSHWARQVFTGGGQPPREAASIRDMKSRAASRGALGYLPAGEVDQGSGLKILFRVD